MTAVALVLTVSGMGAALSRHRRAPLHALTAVGMGAVLLLPAVRGRAPGWLLNVVCSGSMIAAMAV